MDMGCELTKFTNGTTHLSHIPQCIAETRNVYISALNGAFVRYGTGALRDVCHRCLTRGGGVLYILSKSK